MMLCKFRIFALAGSHSYRHTPKNQLPSEDKRACPLKFRTNLTLLGGPRKSILQGKSGTYGGCYYTAPVVLEVGWRSSLPGFTRSPTWRLVPPSTPRG